MERLFPKIGQLSTFTMKHNSVTELTIELQDIVLAKGFKYLNKPATLTPGLLKYVQRFVTTGY